LRDADAAVVAFRRLLHAELVLLHVLGVGEGDAARAQARNSSEKTAAFRVRCVERLQLQAE
jgi:hypothetical protein